MKMQELISFFKCIPEMWASSVTIGDFLLLFFLVALVSSLYLLTWFPVGLIRELLSVKIRKDWSPYEE